MIEYKMLEVRDRATCIPVIAFKVIGDGVKERFFMYRGGFSHEYPDVFVMIYSGECTCNYDPYGWGGRTMPTAHKYIRDNFDYINNFDVIDVEYILGEKNSKKSSEIWY